MVAQASPSVSLTANPKDQHWGGTVEGGSLQAAPLPCALTLAGTGVQPLSFSLHLLSPFLAITKAGSSCSPESLGPLSAGMEPMPCSMMDNSCCLAPGQGLSTTLASRPTIRKLCIALIQLSGNCIKGQVFLSFSPFCLEVDDL